ncbi:MAG: arginine decarboxylase, pyruvoyl-dependent [bacterium]
MIFTTPSKYFFVRGSAEGPSFLNSFDNALLAAGIGNTNLIRVSSILPPGAEEIAPLRLPFGCLVPIAYTYESSELPGEVIAAAVAVGVPEDDSQPGIIMEYHAKGRAEDCEETARQFVRNAFENRGNKPRRIQSVGIATEVKRIATAFAGVVLWA